MEYWALLREWVKKCVFNKGFERCWAQSVNRMLKGRSKARVALIHGHSAHLVQKSAVPPVLYLAVTSPERVLAEGRGNYTPWLLNH